MQEKINSLFDMNAIRTEIREIESSLKAIKGQSGFVILPERKVVLYGAIIFVVGLAIGLLW